MKTSILLVPYELRQDRCVGRNNICSQIDVNAVCYLKENSCACASGYYRSAENCGKLNFVRIEIFSEKKNCFFQQDQ